MGVVICIYIAFCVFTLMNMATGVFVDQACRKAKEDQDNNTANHISELFFTDEEDDTDITWEKFKEKLSSREMQDYFTSINVDPSEAKDLFQLLDRDDSGSVDAEELVNGCLRLRGQPKALELSLLMHQTTGLSSDLHEHIDRADAMFTALSKVLIERGGPLP